MLLHEALDDSVADATEPEAHGWLSAFLLDALLVVLAGATLVLFEGRGTCFHKNLLADSESALLPGVRLDTDKPIVERIDQFLDFLGIE
jgi:hypothetical protein